MTQSFQQHFATLLGEFVLPDATALNQQLVGLICAEDQLQEQKMTTVKSGWQTRHGFLKQEQSAIKQLRKFIDQSLRSYVEAATRSLADRSIKLRFTYDGWATVLLDGGYQHQHTHSRADLVGVYCVERELLPAGAKLGGELTLLDPRSGKQAIQSAWNSEEVTLSPEPGKLIIFPAFLPHRVNEVSGSGHRITINFDVQVGMLPRE